MKHIRVNTSAPAGIVSPWLRGACMEDVNHELYGGIWSQMIFGEWFSEDADRGLDTEALNLLGKAWDLCGNTVLCDRESGGPKLIFNRTSLTDGTVSAKIHLKDNGLALAGKLLESTEPEIQENARKIGEIIKILYPDLTEDVDAVIYG